MAMATEEVIAEMVAKIVQEVDPEQVYLFGSRARGDAREDSDVDFLIVKGAGFDPQMERRHEEGRLYRALVRCPLPVEVLVYSADEVEYRRTGRNNVVARALREGRLVYERP